MLGGKIRKYLVVILLISFVSILLAGYKMEFHCPKCNTEYTMYFNGGEMIEDNKGYCCTCKDMITILQNYNYTNKREETGKIIQPQYNWYSRNSKQHNLTTEDINDLVYTNNIFITVGNNGSILTSSNGIRWNKVLSKVNDGLLGITYGSNIFVAFGKMALITSIDGIVWTDRTSEVMSYIDISGVLKKIVYGNNTFIILTSNNEIMISNDGVNWTKGILDIPQKETERIEIGGITFGNNKFVIVGNMGKNDNDPVALFSIDGTNWSMERLKLEERIFGLNFNNNTFLASDRDNKIYISQNGIDWIKKGFIQINTLIYQVTYFDDTIYVLGWGGVFASTDGIAWTNKLSITCDGLSKIIYGNNSFVVVGMGGTIFQSYPLK